MRNEQVNLYTGLKKAVKTLGLVGAAELLLTAAFLFYPNGQISLTVDETGYYYGRMMCLSQALSGFVAAYFLRRIIATLDEKSSAMLQQHLEELRQLVRIETNFLRGIAILSLVLLITEMIAHGTHYALIGFGVSIVFYLLYMFLGIRPMRKMLDALCSGPLAEVQNAPRSYRIEAVQLAELKKLAKPLMLFVQAEFLLSLFGETLMEQYGFQQDGLWGLLIIGICTYEVYQFFFFESIGKKEPTPEMQYRGLRKIQLAGMYEYPASIVVYLVYAGLQWLCFGGGVAMLVPMAFTLGLVGVFHLFWRRFREKLDEVLDTAVV